MIAPEINIFGDHGVLLKWSGGISEEIHLEIMRMERFIIEIYDDAIIECVPAFNSLAIYLHRDIDPTVFIDKVQNNYPKFQNKSKPEPRNLVTVPVCYESEFSPDLDRVATFSNLPTAEVIRKHIRPTYRVYFIGFLPGFPYLGGLDPKIHVPRLSTPRKKVERGSVGIGDKQTGIYTIDSPGGWNVIGRSPLLFFSPNENPPSLLRAGDFVRFHPVRKKEFNRILKSVEAGDYIIEREVSYD